MTDDDFNRVFGARQPNHPSFTDRVSRGDSFGGRADPAAETSVGSGPYKPYGYLPTGNVGESCEVRSWVKGSDVAEGVVFQYRFLMQVGFVGDELLRLMLPDAIVVIEGKGLTELRQKLARRMVTFVQQYHPGIWPGSPSGEPIIDKIEVVRPETFNSRG